MKKLFLFIIFFISCTNTSFETLDQSTAYKELMTDSSINLIDVREPSEFATGYIFGAQLIPLNTIESNIENIISEKDTKIFVYCRSGNRSAQAAQIGRAHV